MDQSCRSGLYFLTRDDHEKNLNQKTFNVKLTERGDQPLIRQRDAKHNPSQKNKLRIYRLWHEEEGGINEHRDTVVEILDSGQSKINLSYDSQLNIFKGYDDEHSEKPINKVMISNKEESFIFDLGNTKQKITGLKKLEHKDLNSVEEYEKYRKTSIDINNMMLPGSRPNNQRTYRLPPRVLSVI